MTQSFDAYDIPKAVKDMIAGNSVVIGESTEPYTDPNTKLHFFQELWVFQLTKRKPQELVNW